MIFWPFYFKPKNHCTIFIYIALYYIYLHLYKNNIYMLTLIIKRILPEMNLEDNEVKDDV